MLVRLPPIASFAETKGGCAGSAVHSSCKRACGPEDEDRDRVGETRLGMSCCRNLLVKLSGACCRLRSIASMAAACVVQRSRRSDGCSHCGLSSHPLIVRLRHWNGV